MAYVLSDELKIIDLRWPWRPLRAIVAKRCDRRYKLLLITYWLSNNMNIIDLGWTWRSL